MNIVRDENALITFEKYATIRRLNYGERHSGGYCMGRRVLMRSF